MMKILRYLALFAMLFFNVHLYSIAEWTILVYMEADNNLTDCAESNLSEMISAYQKVAFNGVCEVNTLVQLDLPNDQKTWRFRIDRTGKVDDGTINQEMGVHPVEELVRSGQWMKSSHPAKHYGIILWNHGSGVEDYKNIQFKSLRYNQFWLELGKSSEKNMILKKFEKIKSKQEFFEKGLVDKRGILYDDSDKTCLTNYGLTSALTQIKDIFGRKIDFIGMDACLMAMVEVAYQMKDLVEVFVGSQQLEPCSGWQYKNFLFPLISNPEIFTATNLATLAVNSYGDRYAKNNYTLSAINMNAMDAVCAHIDAVATTVLECMKYKSAAVRAALRNARANSMEFDTQSYIDLYSFYTALHAEVVKLKQAAEDEPASCWGFCKTSSKYIPALDRLMQYLVDAPTIINKLVIANAATGTMKDAKGISIYYPDSILKIHGSYPNTLFAQRIPSWYSLIKKM